jgi:Arc/MetJ family transcription regulator
MNSQSSILSHMPNQRAAHIKRTTITVDDSLYAWAMQQARRTGINDFSTFVRTLIAAERSEVLSQEKTKSTQRNQKPK